jgi:membrane-associated phospholipid phosphatase
MSTLVGTPAGASRSPSVPEGSSASGHVESTWLAHRLVSAALLAMLPVVVITVDVLAGGPLRHLDDALAGAAWHRSDQLAVHAALVLDRLGQRAIAGSVVVAVAVLLAWWRRSWQPLMVTGVALLVLNLVVGSLKLLIGRTKPLSGLDLLYAGGSQFPSGHAANAVVSWGLLTYLVLVHGPALSRRVSTALLVMPAAVTVGMSAASLYLDYHWLTDLLAGAALGLVLLALVLAWDLRRRDPRLPRTPEPATEGAAGLALAPTRPPV